MEEFLAESLKKIKNIELNEALRLLKLPADLNSLKAVFNHRRLLTIKLNQAKTALKDLKRQLNEKVADIYDIKDREQGIMDLAMISIRLPYIKPE